VNWPLQYFLDGGLQKSTLHLLLARKTAHVHSTLQEHLEQEMTVSQQQMALSHWPTTMIGLGGES
jgi:hypothetical protein